MFEEITPVDIRERALSVNNQEIPSSDALVMRINIIGTYQVEDPRLAILSTADFQTSLYTLVQLAARKSISSRSYEEILSSREAINTEIMQSVKDDARKQYGLSILSISLKDISPPESIKKASERIIEVEKQAQASLAEARQKVAAARALANAARIIKDNPVILRMQELDVLKDAAQTPGSSIIVHLDRYSNMEDDAPKKLIRK